MSTFVASTFRGLNENLLAKSRFLHAELEDALQRCLDQTRRHLTRMDASFGFFVGCLLFVVHLWMVPRVGHVVFTFALVNPSPPPSFSSNFFCRGKSSQGPKLLQVSNYAPSFLSTIYSSQHSGLRAVTKRRPDLVGKGFPRLNGGCSVDNQSDFESIDRREALLSIGVALSAAVAFDQSAEAAQYSQGNLEHLSLGEGRWIPACEKKPSVLPSSIDVAGILPASFATYASRILINYDHSVGSWWTGQEYLVRLLPRAEQRNMLGMEFGSLAQSVCSACHQFVLDRRQENGDATGDSHAFADLANVFLSRYGKDERDLEFARQIGILFSLLPAKNQPKDILNELSELVRNGESSDQKESLFSGEYSFAGLPASFTYEQRELLPRWYRFEHSSASESFVVTPETAFWEVGLGDEKNPTTAIGTVFGPLATTPLSRQRPVFGPDIYALLGISGGVGCALTHTVVIPLDVVKTRMQTDADNDYAGMVDGAVSIAKNEGPAALFLGSQATIAGYLWYGISVYPAYTFFKRWIAESLLDPAVALLHNNSVSLVAGALAAVVASIGLTPLEACRIRTVADPEKYRPLGLVGTAIDIAREEASAGWATLYAGFNSLLVRQVIFGSVKFLAFERACESIYSIAPSLRSATATALLVSLVAGGFSGALSSVVSQPADSVLTFVAQKGEGLGVLKGCRIMMEEEGPASLFRGLGSRCVWAGSIIAGQFLLYDVFRTAFGVNGDDLLQVFNVVITGR